MTERPDDLQAALGVSRETLVQLQIYVDLLRKWTKRINLVAPKSLDQVWTRHILDSTQVFDLAPKNATSWVDLGSGAGFPGLERLFHEPGWLQRSTLNRRLLPRRF